MFDVKIISFIQSSIVRTFLFESSKYFASEGNRVHYISKEQLQNLPPSLQGVQNTDIYAEFMQMTFVTAPEASDLANYLISLPKSVPLPRVLVVENLTNYMNSDYDFLLLCSILKHTAQLCSKVHKKQAFVILSMKFEPEKLNIVNLVLKPEKIWRTFVQDDDNDDAEEAGKIHHYSVQNISQSPINSITQVLEFSSLKKDNEEFLRLNNISRLFEEGCNFNNKVF